MVLQRCIQKAKILSGASHLSRKEARFSGLSTEAIDLRRLFDSFRTESGAVILIYSKKEERLLFVSNSIRQLLGWSRERFIGDFSTLIGDSGPLWRHALLKLQSRPEAQLSFTIKTKSGKEKLISCALGIIPEGVFVDHIVGVLYVSSDKLSLGSGEKLSGRGEVASAPSKNARAPIATST